MYYKILVKYDCTIRIYDVLYEAISSYFNTFQLPIIVNEKIKIYSRRRGEKRGTASVRRGRAFFDPEPE